MNVYVLLYKECVLYEIILSCYFLKTKYNIITVAIDEEEISGYEGLRIKCDRKLEDVKLLENDMVIVTGGDRNLIKNKNLLKDFLQSADELNVKIGAICSGVNVLLENEIIKEDDISKYSVNTTSKAADRFVLAKPNEYVDFAIRLGIIADIYIDKADYEETIDFFKYFKPVN